MNNLSKEENAYIEYMGAKSRRIQATDTASRATWNTEALAAEEALLKELLTKESEAFEAWGLAYYESIA